MKSQLIAIVAAVLVVGCGELQPPEPPDISIYDAAGDGNIEAVKQHIAAGTDLNAKMQSGHTPLQDAATKAVAELLITKGCALHCLWPSHFVLSIYLVHSYALPSFHSHE